MTKQRRQVPSIDFEEDLARRLQDPEFAHHFRQRRLIHEVALAVRSMRERAGLTQAELANAIKTSQPTIARLEKGLDQRAPRWDTLNGSPWPWSGSFALRSSRTQRQPGPWSW